MGVAQKTMFSISDHWAKFFGIFGEPMEHNTIAKSKETFFTKMYKRPRTSILLVIWTYFSRVIGENARKMVKNRNLRIRIQSDSIKNFDLWDMRYIMLKGI